MIDKENLSASRRKRKAICVLSYWSVSQLKLCFLLFAVHFVIVNGPSGPSIFDRYLFMRASKYNIGGLVLNLMDVSFMRLQL